MICLRRIPAPRASQPLLALGVAALVLGFALGGARPSRAQQPQEGWAVYDASSDISSMGLLVASTATVGDIRTCTLLGGGLCSGDPATDRKLSDVNITMVLGPYPTEYEAEKAFCDNIVPGSEFRAALSSMMMAQMAFDGQNHGISNGPACPPATPAPPTAVSSPTNTPPGTATPELGTCFIEGVVLDAGARPSGPSTTGDPLVGVRMALVDPSDRELKVAATDNEGRYQLAISDGDLPPGFDATLDAVEVQLRLREFAHEPNRFEILMAGAPSSLLTDSFLLADECDDGRVDRDFFLDAIPADYVAVWPLEVEFWDDLGELYDRFWRGFALADLLRQPLDYQLPLRICAFCTGVATTKLDVAFWCGANSNGALCSNRPFIAFGNDTSQLSDWGWPDNREYHEFGHHFLADSFSDSQPKSTGDANHAGYYKNPSSTDSWTEAFATFYSLMIAKHVDGDPRPELYRMGRFQRNYEFDYRPWFGLGKREEVAITGLLLDLEDGPDDYAQGREQPILRIAWHDLYDDRGLGWLLVGEVENRSAYGNYSEQTMVAAQFFDANGEEVFVGWGVSIPWDLPGAGSRGFFSIAVPPDLTWDSLSIVAFEGRPGDLLTDDDPVNLTVQEVWDTIALYTSVQGESNGYLFDVNDLYDAFHSAYGGMDADGNGMDDIDQVFIAHGLFGDPDGDRSFRNEPPGRTDHPAFREFPERIPRRDLPAPPEGKVEVNTGGVDARVIVQVAVPEPNQYLGYAYITAPDEDGRVDVEVPPPQYGGSATLTVVAQGYMPAIAGVIDAETFWRQVDEGDGEPFLSFDVTLEQGDIVPPDGGGVNAGWLLLAAGGVAVMAGGASVAVMRRRGKNA